MDTNSVNKPIVCDNEKTRAESGSDSGVDKGLVAMFLKMTPEERLRANDNAMRAILELRNAYQQRQKIKWRGPEFDT